MTQKLRYFCTLLLMAVVGVAWAQSDYSDDYTGNVTLSTTGGTSASACVVNVGSTGYNGIKAGTGKSAGAVKVSVPAGTKYLHLHVAAWNNENVTLDVTPTGYSSGIALTSNSGISNNSPFTFNGDPSTSDYYKVITFSEALTDNTDLTFTATGGKRFVIWGVTAEEETTGDVVNTQVTIDASGITNTDIYAGTAAGQLSAMVTESESGAAVSGATITWTSSQEDVATVASDGTVTLVAAGATTITASYAGVEDEYKASSATYQLTVTNSDPNAPGTENNPYTVAEALANTPASGTSANVYVRGIVSRFQNEGGIMEDGNNFRYYISDDGTTTSEIQVYRGKGLNNVAFSNNNDLLVGDEVVIYGGLTTYNTTKEIAANNYIVSLNRPVSEDPAVTLDDYTIDVPVEGANGILTVQYQNIDDVAADVQFYDENGNEVDANYYEVWLTASLDEDNNVNYIAIENNGEERKAYFKVYALVGDNSVYSEVYSDMITITQAAYVAPSIATLPFEFNGGRAAIEETDGLTQEGLGTDYSANNAPNTQLKFDNTGDWLLLQFDEKPGKLSFDIKGNGYSATTTSTFTVQTSEDGVTFTELVSYQELGDAETKTFTLDANVRYVKWVYTNKGSGNVGLGNIKLEKPATSATITIKNGFKATTFSCDKALDFLNVEGITAYIITDDKGSTTKVTKVRANTGLYIEGAAGDYDVPILVDETEAEEITGNLLVGTISEPVNTKTLEGNYTYYLFGKQNGKEAFFKVGESTSDSKATASAGKAYLAVPGAGNAKEMIVIGGDVTGIESIENGTIVNDNYYTIDGKLVKGQPTQKGIYVVNGRKVVIK